MSMSGKSISSIFGRSLGKYMLIACCTFQLACTQTAPLSQPAATAFALSPGDKIRVQVYEHPEFSGDFIVDASGVISVPKAGAVPVAGKTLRQSEIAVGQQLNKELNNPQVSINMLEYRPIYVLGQVTQPGQYPYMSGMKVMNAIALAHGYTYRADQSRIKVIRGDDATASPKTATEADILQPGDTVKVLESWY
jgi:protein involved in polysaccharide export with SLBB domain